MFYSLPGLETLKKRYAMKLLLLLCATLLTSVSAQATNYFNKEEKCLQVEDVQAVQGHFRQFRTFTASGTGEICRGEGIDDTWFEVLRSVLALQRLSVNGTIVRDEQDDLTRRPIQEKDWWGYFTQRANDFVILPAYCDSNPGVVAFVYSFRRGQINLCQRFFEMDPGAQIEVLMHEVRHFDGHPHVTCTQGNEAGTPGACDDVITRGGSYAVSVQVSVELAFVDQLSLDDRALAEASATYSVSNKFNTRTKVKVREYIYLANEAGELHRADLTKLPRTEFVAKLAAPARVLSNGSQLTIFPLDSAQAAYRRSRDLTVNVQGLGAFANLYNAKSPQEREAMGAANYLGFGGITENDVIHAFCGKSATGLSQHRVAQGPVKALLNLMPRSTDVENVVVTDAGEALLLTCNQDTGAMRTTPTSLPLPRDVVSGFSVTPGEAFVLTERGELLSVNLKSGELVQIRTGKKAWVSATPLTVHTLFE